MDENYPPILVDATPDDLLAILRDMHRQQCAFDGAADDRIILSRTSTIADWRQACDLIGWRGLAEAFNDIWAIDIPLDRWRAVLEPAKSHKLGEVCDLLSGYVKVPGVRPARLLGRECVPAGIFLTVRSCLASAGADVSDIAPSTPLAEYARRYAAVFLGPVSQLAPGKLPTVKISTPDYDACALICMLAFIGIVVGNCIDLPLLTVGAVLVAMVAYLGLWIAARCTLPASVDFEGLVTFRDLCKALAAGARTVTYKKG